MQRQVLYGMLALFMLFLITADPGGTGEEGRNFVGWISTGWDDTREFVGSLLDDDSDEPERNELGEVPIPTLGPEEPPPDTGGDGGDGGDGGVDEGATSASG
ncbi:MAG: hypothetical protein AAF480_02775 [Actinomycetota bacterium]